MLLYLHNEEYMTCFSSDTDLCGGDDPYCGALAAGHKPAASSWRAVAAKNRTIFHKTVLHKKDALSRLLSVWVAFVISLWACPALAGDGAGPSVNLGLAAGDGSSVVYDLGATYTFEPWFEGEFMRLSPLLEASAFYWHKGHEDLWGGGLATGFNLQFNCIGQIRPFVTASIGLAWLSDNSFDSRKFGGATQFRSRGIAGVSFGEAWRHSLGIAYTHYSNASMHSDNAGFNSVGVIYSYRF